jgi:SAM-dependent methyltransferase
VTGAVTCLHPGGLELTDRLLAAAGLRPGAAVLDVGCGAGVAVARLADYHGLQVTGLDASREGIEQAAEARPDLDFVAGRAEALPFPDASFDAVLCECVLSTLDDPGRALAEMARVLRPDGAALLSDVYVRSGSEAARDGAVAALGRRETVERLFEAAGLRPSTWNDESGVLGRYLWDLAGSLSARTAPPPERRAVTGARRLGYFVCVARLESATVKGAWSG